METQNKAEEDFFVVALKEEARTILWEVGSNTDPKTLVSSCLEDLQALAPREQGSETRSEQEIWTQVRQRLLRAAYATRPHCVRCGTCCTKGSPTLLKEDLELLRDTTLKPEHLMTVRKGEKAYSSRTDKLASTATELIKIREKPDSRTCLFFDPWAKQCAIYDSRPTQCRKQECWNPDAAQDSDAEIPLAREELLQATGSLWDVIQQHEERCSHADLNRAMARLEATEGATIDDLLELLRFDHHVRWFMTEKLNLDPAAMDFFFGRSLTEIIRSYGLKVEQQGDGSFLVTPLEEQAE
jgi:Fe-S-cluster containining protein